MKTHLVVNIVVETNEKLTHQLTAQQAKSKPTQSQVFPRPAMRGLTSGFSQATVNNMETTSKTIGTTTNNTCLFQLDCLLMACCFGWTMHLQTLLGNVQPRLAMQLQLQLDKLQLQLKGALTL